MKLRSRETLVRSRSSNVFTAYTLRFAMVCWDSGWNCLQFRFLHNGKTMALGHAKGVLVSRAGFVRGQKSRAALGLAAASPAFPPSISAWILAEWLMRA